MGIDKALNAVEKAIDIAYDAVVKHERKRIMIYQKMYMEVMCYFDSISDEKKPKLHKKLVKLEDKLIKL